MRTTKSKQRSVRRQLDEKLSLSTPPHSLLEELASKCTTNPNPDNTFQYAFALSKSNQKSELQYSISMLDSLVKNGYEHQVDCMYGSATAHYLLGNYNEAQFLCEAILRNRPENEAAAQLHTAALSAKDDREEKMVRDVAIGGTAAVAAVGLALLLGEGSDRVILVIDEH